MNVKQIRLLFTSIGRRVELLQAFRSAAERLNITIEIHGTDITDSAPALKLCDYQYIVPRIHDEKYIPSLLEICRKQQIHVVIPTIDTDLLVLAESTKLFEEVHTRVVVSAPERISLCRNKRKTTEYFRLLGLKTPKVTDDVTKYQDGFPAFIKPKDGSSSIDAYRAKDERELLALSGRVADYMIQPFITGTEFTVDIMCDFDGNPVFITPRIRLAVRAGEVLKTQIRQDDRIISEMERLIVDFKPCGPITVQLIQDAKGVNHYIEINPRFGGGVPLSIKAGADSAEALLRLIGGETMNYIFCAAEDGAVYSRYDQSMRVK